MNTILIGISVYILLQFIIGLLASRRAGDEKDYLLAGRSLGPILGTFTVFATWYGAESVIGAAGLIYSDGFSGATGDPFGYAFCLIILGLVYAIPLWRRQYTTFGDFFRQRYSSGVEKLFVLLVVPSSIFWAAAQVRAFGHIISVVSDIDVELAIMGAATLITLYTMAGGMRATAITDLIQGIALIAGLLVLFFAVINAHGLVTLIESVPPERMQFLSAQGMGFWEVVEQWALPICGATLAAEVISRILATNSAGTARSASVLGGLLYLVFGFLPVFLGLIGPGLIAGLEEPEQIIPALASQHLATLPYILFAGALVSAILSTVDSALLAAASLLSHNIVVPLKGSVSERQKVRIARTAVVILGVLAWYLAVHAGGVYELIETAVAFGTAGVFVVGTIGLFCKFGDQYSAYAALIAGSFIWFVAEYYSDVATPYLLALAGAILAYVTVGLLERALPARAGQTSSS